MQSHYPFTHTNARSFAHSLIHSLVLNKHIARTLFACHSYCLSLPLFFFLSFAMLASSSSISSLLLFFPLFSHRADFCIESNAQQIILYASRHFYTYIWLTDVRLDLCANRVRASEICCVSKCACMYSLCAVCVRECVLFFIRYSR